MLQENKTLAIVGSHGRSWRQPLRKMPLFPSKSTERQTFSLDICKSTLLLNLLNSQTPLYIANNYRVVVDKCKNLLYIESTKKKGKVCKSFRLQPLTV